MTMPSTASRDDVLDLVCVGFGPAALSLAVTMLEDARDCSINILDRKPCFSWRADITRPASQQMKTNFLQDLVSQQNPKSHFTFVNYLWQTGNLVSFLNLGLMHPPRQVFSSYLKWCADQIDSLGWTKYGAEVKAIEPVVDAGRQVKHWRLIALVNGSVQAILCKRVVIAVGSQSKIPQHLTISGLQGRIQHISQFRHVAAQISSTRTTPVNIAIIGGNSDAVSMIQHCQMLREDAIITVMVEKAALMQNDSNPFSANLVESATSLPFELRRHQTANTRYADTVDRDSLLELYQQHYNQLVRNPDPHTHALHIKTSCRVIGAHVADGSSRVQLQYSDVLTGVSHSAGPYDFVLVTTSSEEALYDGLTQRLQPFFDSPDGRSSIDSGYRINFKRHSVAESAGVWLLNGFEADTDDVFSYLALRSQRVKESLLAAAVDVECGSLQRPLAIEPSVL